MLIGSHRHPRVRVEPASILRLSQIANNPSILMDSGEALLGDDPEIHFDVADPTPPIEMCDVYCIDVRGTCDGGRKVAHGHIYGDIPGSGGLTPPSRAQSPAEPAFEMCDVYCFDANERMIHGHIYGTDKPGSR